MSYRARDGKLLPTVVQGRKYEASLPTGHTATVQRSQADLERAPGGLAHEEAYRLHGPARHIEIDIEDGGRYHMRATHMDGYQYEAVHPQAHVANDVFGHLIGVNPPMAIETHSRARAHPVGEKEIQRIDREDGRLPKSDDGVYSGADFEDKP